MSAPYREASSRLKRLLSEGGVVEGSLYRADRGKSIYVPADFAPLVADWSARWAEAKRLMKEMSEIARSELVAAITERTGRRTVATPAGAQAAGPRKRPTAKRRSQS